jgi:hypothetical protein
MVNMNDRGSPIRKGKQLHQEEVEESLYQLFSKLLRIGKIGISGGGRCGEKENFS